MERSYRLVAPIVALLILVVGLGSGRGGGPLAVAQQATPQPAAAPTRDVPQPAECQVAPRPLAAYVALVQSASAASTPVAVASPTAFVPPQGTPADPTTTAAITATVRQLIGCLNAGDQLRYYALVTDHEIQGEVAQFGPPPQRYLDLLAKPPVPGRGAFQTIALLAVRNVQTLPDGRVSAVVVQDDGADPRPRETIFVAFTQADSTWLVDEIHYDVPLGGTPTP